MAEAATEGKEKAAGEGNGAEDPDAEEQAPGVSWDKKLEQDWTALEFAPDDYKSRRDMVLVAVQQNGLAIKWAAEELLQEDQALVLEATKRYGQALKYAPTKAYNDEGAAIRLDRDDR